MENDDNLLKLVSLIRIVETPEEGRDLLIKNFSLIKDEVQKIEDEKSRERFINYAKEYAVELSRRNKEKEKMKTSTDYIEWLVTFTKKETGFDSTKWDYIPNEIIKKDKDNVDKLHLFIDVIAEYAEAKEIEFGKGYQVKYNGAVLEVGSYHGQGNVDYAILVPEDKIDKDAIPYGDILIYYQEEVVKNEITRSLEEEPSEDPNNSEELQKAVKKLQTLVKKYRR